MGMQLTVNFTGLPPSWAAIQKRFSMAGLPIQIRMIDGLPAYPDETPPESWNEVRISSSAGMITLRQSGGRITLIIWGNADADLIRHWQISAWACAAAGDGTIDMPEGALNASEYLKATRLFEL